MPEYLFLATLAGFCAGSLCAMAGVFVVTMHLSFLGVCLAHAAFAGAVVAVWLGLNPALCALAFAVTAAFLIGPLADRGEISADTSAGLLFSFTLGLAFLVLGLQPGSRADALDLFWGSILTTRRADVILMAGALLLFAGLLWLFFKEIRAVLCHRNVALAAGIPATLIFYAMLTATGAAIAVSLPSIGGILVYALVVNPAAAAMQLTYNLRNMFLWSAVFGVLSCWTGLGVSYAWGLPAGASTILAAAALFALAIVFSPKRRIRHAH